MFLVRRVLVKLALLVVAVSSVTEEGLGREIRLRLAHVYPEPWPIHGALMKAANEFEIKTEGFGTIEIYPDGALGYGSAIFSRVRAGSVDLVVVPASYLSFRDPALEVLRLPFIFRDREHFERFLSSKVRNIVAQRVERTGLQLLAAGWIGPRHLLARAGIASLEDLAGVRLRPSSSTRMEQTAFEALGAIPVAVSFAETYTAAQVGVLDATTGLPSTFVDSKLFEAFGTVSLDSIGGVTAWLLAGPDLEQQLPLADRRLLVGIMREAIRKSGTAAAEREADALDQLAEAGVKPWRFSPDTSIRLRDKALDAMAASAPPETAELLKAIRALE